MVVRESETSKRKPWGRNRLVQKCKESPVKILIGVFLLYVLVAQQRPPLALWPAGAMLATVEGGWRAQQEGKYMNDWGVSNAPITERGWTHIGGIFFL